MMREHRLVWSPSLCFQSPYLDTTFRTMHFYSVGIVTRDVSRSAMGDCLLSLRARSLNSKRLLPPCLHSTVATVSASA